ncbi:MAG: hypothetical protein ACPLYX_10655 [Rectinema subterraneum]|uniref:hypothetical protein n=1 Tax=Rectinema subterraneum TaxID=2653714 RepID=UPI003C7EA61A
MTKNQALEIIRRYPDAKNYIKQSHLENLSPLVEVAIEVIICKKEDFHTLPGNTYMPRKETVDRFAMAAGISFNPLEESTRKEADCYIGRSQAMLMGPDGKYCYGDVCEYEYDVSIRHEEEMLIDRNSRAPRLHAGAKPVEDRARLAYLSLRKTARQRANTGARSRAILSILGMQTGFKDLFAPDAPPTAEKTFLFSRIIVNTKNEMVLHRMLDNLTGTTKLLYGNDAKQLEAQSLRPALPVQSEPDEEPEAEDTGPTQAIESIQQSLESGLLGPRAIMAAKDALLHHQSDEAYLADIAARLKAAIENRKHIQQNNQ